MRKPCACREKPPFAVAKRSGIRHREVMKTASSSLGWLAAALLFGLAGPSFSQDASDEPDDPVIERDWLESYYEAPTPEQFVERMREYSRDGVFLEDRARPALIGFISQVMRQNRDKIKTWHEELRSLSPEELQVIHTAMLYSRTSEADEVLQAAFGERFEEQKKELPRILEMKLAQTHSIDMLWGFFYATGSENAVRRVIGCFIFADAPDNPDFAEVPEGFSPLYTDLPEAAAWTLVSNASRHPKVLEICEKLYDSEGALNPTERRLLRESVLLRFKPEKYQER